MSEQGLRPLLEDYASYLVGERSLAPGTVRYYLRFARLFIASVSDGTGLDLGATRLAT